MILERNLTLDEIRAICRATTAEVECFVHGAICVGYSGRCFLSRSMSARSGNRGACSQPCRLTYDLTDGRGRTYLQGRHLLSVRDLNLSEHLGELIDAGVSSFKIEGRLKDLTYIRNVVAYYRRAVDEALAARPQLQRASVGESRPDFDPDPSKSFTRGESEYFFAGKCAGVASFDTPKAVGERIGRAVRVERNAFRLESPEGGGSPRVTASASVRRRALSARTSMRWRVRGSCPTAWRDSPGRGGLPQLRPALHAARRAQPHAAVIPATARVETREDGVRITFTDCEGFTAAAERRVALDAARNPEANAASLRQQAARSGDTIFEVRDVELHGAERFVPASLLAELRREGLDRLLAARMARRFEHRILPENSAARYLSEQLTAEENVTNRLAEAFYRDHGVQRIERGLDLAPTTVGHPVMRTSYCIRREIGECLKEHPRLRGELWLERGRHRYRLAFDCVRCEMSLVDASGSEMKRNQINRLKMRKQMLALTALLLTGVVWGAAAQTWNEWRDPEVNAVNRLPMRSSFEAGERLSLDGIWRFMWVRDASDRPEGIWRTDYDDRAWGYDARSRHLGGERLRRPGLCQCGLCLARKLPE